MEKLRLTTAIKCSALLIAVSMTGCSKELEIQSEGNGHEQEVLNQKAQIGLFQVINYQGLGLSQDQLGFKVYLIDPNAPAPCWGHIEKPVGSGFPPTYYHASNSTTPPHLSVHGYCTPDPGACRLYQGPTTGTLGPKYLIMPTRIYPGATTKCLILQCRNLYVPMSGSGFYFTYDASANTWTTGNSAATYFEYVLNTFNRTPNCN